MSEPTDQRVTPYTVDLHQRLAAVTAERDALRVALLAVAEWYPQWDGSPYSGFDTMRCLWCRCDQADGHAPDCQRQAALGPRAS